MQKCSEWIDLNEENATYPNQGEFVLVKFDDDFIAISCWLGDEWEISGKMRRTIYKGKEKLYTSCNPQKWMKFPEITKES